MYIVPPLREDELFESWLVKVCQCNDFKIFYSNKIKELKISDINNLNSEDILNICIHMKQYINCDFIKVINNHTLFPYITPFTDSKKILWEDIKMDYMKYLSNAKNYHRRYFNLTEHKVCIQCLNEEFNLFGGAYIHRRHQIPGNFFCIKHNSRLKIIYDFYNYNNNNYLRDNLTEIGEFCNEYTDKLLILSKDINYIVNGILSGFTIDYIKKVIWLKMKESGYIANMLVKNEFFEEFYKHYTYDFLMYLQNQLFSVKEDIFNFNQLILKPGFSAYSPIQIILVIKMLFSGGLREFIYYSKKGVVNKEIQKLNKILNLKTYINLTGGIKISQNLYDHLLETNGKMLDYVIMEEIHG